MSHDDAIVRQANEAFRQGAHARAKALYQQAAARYGHDLFKANIALCDRASGLGQPLAAPDKAACAASDLQKQLDETQRLLEYYFQRCETLEQTGQSRG